MMLSHGVQLADETPTRRVLPTDKDVKSVGGYWRPLELTLVMSSSSFWTRSWPTETVTAPTSFAGTEPAASSGSPPLHALTVPVIEVTVCEPWQCTASIVLSGATSLAGGAKFKLGRIALDTLSCLCSGGKPAPTRVFCLMASTKFVIEFNSERQSTTLFQARMAYRLAFDGACVRWPQLCSQH